MQVTDWLYRAAELYPTRIAVEDASDGRCFTFMELNLRASRFADVLANEHKLAMGSRVAILSHNRPEYLEVLYGCAKAGAVLVCLNWRLMADELLPIIDDCAPSLLVYEPEFAAVAAAIHDAHSECVLLPLDADGGYEHALANARSTAAEMPARDMNDIWHLLYTSGTTGKPKGVLQTYGMVLVNGVNTLLAGKVVQGDVFLNVLPFFHTGGLNLYTNPILMTGGTVIIMRRFDAAATIARLGRDVTSLFGVPAIYLQLAGHPDFANADLTRVRNLSIGGAPVPPSLAEAFARKGVVIAPSYGMTEAGPTIFAADIATAAAKPLSVGKPVGLAQIRIIDAMGEEIRDTARGELMIGGPVVTPGYWNRPTATAESIRDGWLSTGDIACRDADGDVFVVDRKKDMYISGGENVYPAEIESILYGLPGVAEAAVVGVPSEKWGEVGLAVLVAAKGDRISSDEVLLACRSKLAGYKVPHFVRVIDALPRTPSGKVEKHKLPMLLQLNDMRSVT